jgi:hypothetical protein
MSIEFAAMRWLAFDKKCHYVLEQRCPRYGLGSPDVIGVTRGRKITEIEIKRTFSDFKADAQKHHRKIQSDHPTLAPYQLYYLVPNKLAEKVLEIIPSTCGLMCIDKNEVSIKILKDAPINKLSAKLDLEECIRLCRQMTCHSVGYALQLHSIKQRSKYDAEFCHTDWVNAENGTYQI